MSNQEQANSEYIDFESVLKCQEILDTQTIPNKQRYYYYTDKNGMIHTNMEVEDG